MKSTEVESIVSNQRKILEAAEELLRAEAEGGVLGPDEVAVLEAAGITDSQEHERELSRMRRVVRFQSEAGTKTQRDKLQKQIDEAIQDRDDKLPKLRNELEEVVARIEGQIAELSEAVTLPQQRLDAMCQACEHLREDSVLPKHVVRHANLLKSRVKESYKSVTAAETELESLPKIIGMCQSARVSNEVNSREFQNYASVQGLLSTREGSNELILNHSKLVDHIDDLKGRLEKAKQVSEGRENFDDAMKEAGSVRDYYIK